MSKSSLFTLLFLLTTKVLLAQNTFERGHYLDNNLNIVPGFILNLDWRSNPIEIQFKSDSLSQEITLSLNDVSEFEIYNYGKFIRSDVQIDRSPDNLTNFSEVSTKPAPEFKDETLFLKALVEGTVNLYSYQDANLIRFFIADSNRVMEQLIFRYFKREFRVFNDESYKDQLRTKLSCSLKLNNDLKRISYLRDDLIELVSEENLCLDGNSTKFLYDRHYKKFYLTLKPSLALSNFTLSRSAGLIPDFEANSGLKPGFNFGIELERVLSHNNGAWSLVFQASYQQFSGKNDLSDNNETIEVEMDYKSLDIEMGLRYNFLIDKTSKIYFNPAINYDFNFNSTIRLTSSNPNYFGHNIETISDRSLKFVLGYSLKNFRLEMSYLINRELIEDVQRSHSILRNNSINTATYSGTYSFLFVSFGYSIF